MPVTGTWSMQTGSTLKSMETGLELIVIKRHKKLSSMSPKSVTMPTIFS